MSAIVISDGITRKVLHAHSTAPVSGDAIAKLPLVHRAPGELWTRVAAQHVNPRALKLAQMVRMDEAFRERDERDDMRGPRAFYAWACDGPTDLGRWYPVMSTRGTSGVIRAGQRIK